MRDFGVLIPKQNNFITLIHTFQGSEIQAEEGVEILLRAITGRELHGCRDFLIL